LVDRFASKIGINEPSTKTNRLPDCCGRGHVGGPFFMGVTLARSVRTRIGRGPLTTCGRTNTIASSRNRPPALARRRLLAAHSSSTSKTLVPARWPAANSLSTRRLLALAGRRLLLTLARRRLPANNSFSTS
jgi:hypothetical protein